MSPLKSAEVLSKLISFPSIAGQPNVHIVGWVRDILEAAGARVTVVPGPEGDRHNLFASMGPTGGRGIVLSGHLDVVPAGEPDWKTDPFKLSQDGEKLHGRGACDMKGFIAAALSFMTRIDAGRLTEPLHLALSYDEELGCRGVPHLVARLPELCAPPIVCIVGEPTELRPVLAHKGKMAWEIAIHGRSGHSARPELGLNAIHGMGRILMSIEAAAEALSRDVLDAGFEPPYSTMQAGVIGGGRAVNVIPERCSVEIEVRALPSQLPEDLFVPVLGELRQLEKAGYRVEQTIMSRYPGFSLPRNSKVVELVEAAAGNKCRPAVSFGTEAGLFQQAGWSVVVCGPGDIGRAHKANEYITVGELEQCDQFLHALTQEIMR